MKRTTPMEFYVISPVSNLQPMLLGDRLFVLAHLWKKWPHYREFVLQQQAGNPNLWITLDNSAAERALVSHEVLLDIVAELRPNEVIAPDVLFDATTTITNATRFYTAMSTRGLLEHTEIFFCPQGATRADWLKAYKWALSQKWISTIGFSKIAIPNVWAENPMEDQNIMESRHAAYDYLLANDLLQKPIHCLGQGNPTEFAYYKHPMMRSTDSVYPVLAAFHNQSFNEDYVTRIPTPHEFLETCDMVGVDLDLIESNVNFLRKQCALSAQ